MPPIDMSHWQPLGGGAGAIENWPMMGPKSMSRGGTGLGGRAKTAPRLLQELEMFREQELFKLMKLNPEQCSDDTPSEARVEIDRQCFDAFNRNFKTYEPLLSKIKRDYDQLLDHYARGAREADTLRYLAFFTSLVLCF